MKRIARLSRAALLSLISLAAAAQAPTKPAPAPPSDAFTTGPAISDALRAEFFKAHDEMTQSAAAAKAAQDKFQAAVLKMQQVCGERATLQMNQAGDPVCAVRPTFAPAKK